MIAFLMFVGLLFAQQPVDDSITVEAKREDFQLVRVYLDISQIIGPDGKSGTSNQLNILLSDRLNTPYQLKHRLQYWSNPQKWKGQILIYDWDNIKFMEDFSDCDYSNAIKCGVQNKHWTLRTVVTIGKKFSTITMKLYDEEGIQIAKGSKTAWGTILWKPRWKLTKISEQGPFGGGKKEIFEMWPPEMEEVPPLIKPYHIGQAKYGVYEVRQLACRSNKCKEVRK